MNVAALQQLLFVSIETVSAYPSLEDAPATYAAHWQHKVETLRHGDEPDEIPYARSGLYAEFGRVLCLSLGYMYWQGKASEPCMRITTYAGDERSTLQALVTAMQRFAKQHPQMRLCAHNGNGFDFPYLARRLTVHRMEIPPALRATGRKPWELPRVNTIELWQYGERRNHVSLELLAYTLGITAGDDVLAPEEVHNAYYRDGDIMAIAHRSQRGVELTAQVLLRLTGHETLREEQLKVLEPQLLPASMPGRIQHPDGAE